MHRPEIVGVVPILTSFAESERVGICPASICNCSAIIFLVIGAGRWPTRRPAIAALVDAESDMNLALGMGWGQIKQGREAIAMGGETDNSKGDGMMEGGSGASASDERYNKHSAIYALRRHMRFGSPRREMQRSPVAGRTTERN
jgi:hypothetical protein